MDNQQEKKFVTDEELNQIKFFRNQQSQIAFALGDLQLRKESLLNSHRTLLTQEQEFFNKLTIKYGDGVIDANTGEITSNE